MPTPCNKLKEKTLRQLRGVANVQFTFNPKPYKQMNFIEGPWTEQINVTDFVKRNITPYEGDASFLVGPTERTRKLWNICLQALE